MSNPCNSSPLKRALYGFAAGLAGLPCSLAAQGIITVTADGDVVRMVSAEGEILQAAEGHGVSGGAVFAFARPHFGPALFTACDMDQDNTATLPEVKAAALLWLHNAKSATKGVCSELELAATLEQYFPVPQAPAGVPAPPVEFALHNRLAKTLLTAMDADVDGQLTSREALTFVEQNFTAWDTDSGGWLDATELALAFRQFMPAPAFISRSRDESGVSAGTEPQP